MRTHVHWNRRSRRVRRAVPLLALVILTLPCIAFCTTWNVRLDGSGHFTAIEDAVSAASQGDVIRVWPGTYLLESRCYFEAGNITLVSTGGSEETILDATAANGAMMFWGSVTTSCVVDGFTMTGATTAVYCTGSSTSFNDCVFTGNVTGIETRYGCYPSFTDCTFSDNNTGLFVFLDCGVTATNCVFSNNAQKGARLTAIPASLTGCEFSGNGDAGLEAWGFDLAIEDCVFTGNGDHGLRVHGGDGAYVSGCTFEGNKGGMTCKSSSPTVSACTFEGNLGAEHGGGVRCTEGAAPTFTNCILKENTAIYGGGVYSSESSPRFVDCSFRGNESVAWGGAVCADVSDSLWFEGCLFYNNTSHRGGAILCYRSSPTFERCTITGNSGDDTGGITCLVGGNPSILQSVVAFNTGPPVFCQGGEAVFEQSIVYGNDGGDGLCGWPRDAIVEDPLFCDYYGRNFWVCSNSPCLPSNNDWSVPVGAYGSGCGECDTLVTQTSWGVIKAMYR